MVLVDPDLDAAVRLARQAVGAPDDLPARTTRVRRLDRDAAYVLVDLGAPGSPGWVAAVDPLHDDVMAWAVNASGESTVPTVPTVPAMPAADAVADYVWWVGGPSRSPLYPLARVQTPDGDRFLDHGGRLHSGTSHGRA